MEKYDFILRTDDGRTLHIYGEYNIYAPYAQSTQHIDDITDCFEEMA